MTPGSPELGELAARETEKNTSFLDGGEGATTLLGKPACLIELKEVASLDRPLVTYHGRVVDHLSAVCKVQMTAPSYTKKSSSAKSCGCSLS